MSLIIGTTNKLPHQSQMTSLLRQSAAVKLKIHVHVQHSYACVVKKLRERFLALDNRKIHVHVDVVEHESKYYAHRVGVKTKAM